MADLPWLRMKNMGMYVFIYQQDSSCQTPQLLVSLESGPNY